MKRKKTQHMEEICLQHSRKQTETLQVANHHKIVKPSAGVAFVSCSSPAMHWDSGVSSSPAPLTTVPADHCWQPESCRRTATGDTVVHAQATRTCRSTAAAAGYWIGLPRSALCHPDPNFSAAYAPSQQTCIDLKLFQNEYILPRDWINQNY